MEKVKVGKSIMVFLILLSLLLSSCASGTGTTQERRNPKDFNTGTEGLVVTFVENNPPSRIYADNTRSGNDVASILLEIKNKGAYPETSSDTNVPRLHLELGGFDPDIFDVRTTVFENGRIDGDLQGKTEFNPNGGYATAYTEATVDFPESVDTYSPIILATLCYQYETAANPQVCMDPDPFSPASKKKVCTAHDVTLGGGQGAPVAVTKIEHDTSASEELFKIYVKNVGGGVVVVDTSNWDVCMSPSQMDLDLIDYDVKLYGRFGDCDPDFNGRSDRMKLINGEGIVFCRFQKDTQSTDAYVTPLSIKLTYKYKVTAQKQIEILSTR